MGLLAGGISVASPVETEVITLTGSSGSPNTSTDVETEPVEAISGWRTQTDGTLQRIVSNNWTDFGGGQWNSTTPAVGYWIRATVDANSTPAGNIGTWDKCGGTSSVTRTWTWTENSNPPALAVTTGDIKLEISTDASGTPIVATGYYRGTSTQLGTA